MEGPWELREKQMSVRRTLPKSIHNDVGNKQHLIENNCVELELQKVLLQESGRRNKQKENLEREDSNQQ